MHKEFRSTQPDNSEQDAVALQHGSAYTLRNADYSQYLLTSDLATAREYHASGWKVLGEIHHEDFAGTVGYMPREE